MNIKPMVSQFSIGADPEMFLVGADGEFQSSIDLLGGSKDNPRPLPHCMVQEDNVMAELNINVSRTREQFIENVGLAIRDLEDLVNPYNLSIAKCATATFKKEKMFDPRCFRFGCDPDYGDKAETLDVPKIPRYTRYAGGHVHLGYDRNMVRPEAMANYLDATVGLFTVVADRDRFRKRKYGTPTRHRPKSYGIEYRTPSNFWIFTPESVGVMYDLVVLAFNKGLGYMTIYNASEIMEAIKKNDSKQAVKLFKTNFPNYDLMDFVKAAGF